MIRIPTTEAGRQIDDLLTRVSRDGVTVEFERDNSVIARLSPVPPSLQVADLNHVFQGLPSLDDDSEAFIAELNSLRHSVPRETDPWD